MQSQKPSCGPLVDVVKTEGVRVGRCPCGTIYLTFSKSGVTVQLAPEYFAEVVQALTLSRTIIDGPQAEESRAVETRAAGGFVTVMMDTPKKVNN